MAYKTIRFTFNNMKEILEFASMVRIDRENDDWVQVISYDPESDTLWCESERGDEYEINLASEDLDYDDVMVCCRLEKV